MTPSPPNSPPLPARHTATTPGPRAARLQELYAQRLQHTLGKLAWDKVAGCYPTVAVRAEGVLRQVQGQMVEKLGEKCEVSCLSGERAGVWEEREREGRRRFANHPSPRVQKEFDNILAARQVIPKLNDLESLISAASTRRAASSPNSSTLPTPYPARAPPVDDPRRPPRARAGSAPVAAQRAAADDAGAECAAVGGGAAAAG
ncbi:hypothetical protein G7046_g9591 [Stylonectria norvegica]|nr:hypothetical protein G7046_g9591 [Stylonectria norvegica]